MVRSNEFLAILIDAENVPISFARQNSLSSGPIPAPDCE